MNEIDEYGGNCAGCGGGGCSWCGNSGEDRSDFAHPGGNSALRAGERTEFCPTCREPNKLTMKDRKLGYQCDDCADKLERGGP